MAERRMFSKSIINSGRFLRMPPTSRLLYYDLGMMADDDGIVEAYSVMTQTKATEDDLRVLVAKGFIRILNDDLVSFICDWNTNNSIRSDRYHPSIYAELLELPDSGIPTDNQMATNGIPTDNQMDTEDSIGKVSIGKYSIDKDNKNNISADLQSAIESEFDVLWKMYPNKKDKAKALKAYKKARTAKKNPVQFETVKYGIEAYVRETRDTDIKYIKHGSTWFNGECWKDYEEQKATEERIEQNANVDPYSGGRNDF